MSVKRHSSAKDESYEHVLMCLICRSLFDDHDRQPKFLPCHHTFCKDCLRGYVRQLGDEVECPSCRKPATVPAAGVSAMQTNFYVKYIQKLVQAQSGVTTGTADCTRHSGETLRYYCNACQKSVCRICCAPDDGNGNQGSCAGHARVSLATVTEQSHQQLDSTFSAAQGQAEEKRLTLESMLRTLAEEKDAAMRQIDGSIEQHVHTLNRRATLLKNKVISHYKEHEDKLENHLEEIATAVTCIVSLKEYHEQHISAGDFVGMQKAIDDMEEVRGNIAERINPIETHILFEDKHGVDKFKSCVKDLGRVRCSRPIPPRLEPDGNDSSEGAAGGGANVKVTARASSPGSDSQHTPDVSSSYDTELPSPQEQQSCDDFTPVFEASPLARLNHVTGQTEDPSEPGQSAGSSRVPTMGQERGGDDVTAGESAPHEPEPATDSPPSGPEDSETPTAAHTSPLRSQEESTSAAPAPEDEASSCDSENKQSALNKLRRDLHLPLRKNHNSAPSGSQSHGNNNSTQQPNKQRDPRVNEQLAKEAKINYTLVYTSYDEEELLKELQSKETINRK